MMNYTNDQETHQPTLPLSAPFLTLSHIHLSFYKYLYSHPKQSIDAPAANNGAQMLSQN